MKALRVDMTLEKKNRRSLVNIKNVKAHLIIPVENRHKRT